MTAFTRFVEEETGRRFSGYAELHAFSVRELRAFWRLFLQFSGLVVEGEVEPVCEGDSVEHARFFPRLRLSYAENLLHARRPGDDARLAVVAACEDGSVVRLSRGELRARVLEVAAGLRALSVGPGDRVVALARNGAETVIACLATAAIGAAWSSVAPDLGAEAAIDRFGQLAPAALFACSRHPYQGIERDAADKVRALASALPSLRALVALDGVDLSYAAKGRVATTLDELAASGRAAGPPALEALPRFPFDHPLFILFSSGTTGRPKCIVHGAGGTLLEHEKEHVLHSDLGPDDVLYFQTATGWMMWNWQLSALAAGATIVLYDGSVTFPDETALWRLVERERVTVLGTSPAYLQYCRDAGLVPAGRFDLSRLRAIQSTGSVLSDALFVWAKEAIKPVPLQSISGGTDIVGCFVMGNPNLPVWAGEMQCVGLGLDVRALGPDGAEAESGELVCASPFPSRPVGLFGDPDGRRFHEAYFAQNPGVWTHGDHVELTERGTARIHGRSDGVLNVRGIRIGPAEITSVLEGFPEIAEAMPLEQPAPAEPGGSRLVLLVVLKEGAKLDRPLALRIKKELSQRRSMAHVPAAIADVPELPTTHSGKRSARAARDALAGREVVNAGALQNPACLDAIREHPALRLDG